MSKLSLSIIVGAVAVFIFSAIPASALPVANISDNSGVSGDIAQYLTCDIRGENGLVLFDFTFSENTLSSMSGSSNTELGVITGVYFDDDGGLLSNMIFPISFSSSSHFPEGGAIGFNVDHGAAANNPAPHNGVGPGGSLEVSFAGDLGAVLAAYGDESLRIGIRVQGLAEDNEYSDSFIVPEPATALLVGTALFGLLSFAGVRRRFRKN